MLVGELLDAGRKAQLLEARHGLRDHAEGERDRAALPVGVDAEPRQIAVLVGDVEVARVAEKLEPLRRAGPDDLEHGLQVGVRQRRALVESAELAVAPEHGRLAELQVDVAGAEVDGTREETVEIHAARTKIGRIGREL